MTYFNRPWTDALRLEDGTIVSSFRELEHYLREHGMTMSADYSADWWRKSALRREAKHRKDLFAEFLFHYKRSIWNAKSQKAKFRAGSR